MISLTVNGQVVTLPPEATLLDAVRAAGADLPTLCHHDGLAPYGACRLCLVAITAPRQEIVTACTYPVEEGLVVESDARQAVAARRLMLEFLLSRCSQSALIRQLAADEGVSQSRFPSQPERADELCVLCGLCVRVCQEAIGAAALCFVGRGEERRVSTPFDLQAEACIGCGACAEICPTGAVEMEDRGDQRILHTWHTTVELHACPDCGRFFAPEPSVFLEEKLPEIEKTWRVCPECRRQRTARQWLEETSTRPT